MRCIALGKRERRKGADAERELMHILNEQYGMNVKRGDCFRYQPDLMGLESIHIEVKRSERINLTSWLNQATQAAERYHSGIPAVFHRKSREPWFVSMLQDDFDQMDPVDVLLTPSTGTCNPIEDINEQCDGVIYFRKIGEVVTMKLEDWIGVYCDWKLPFTD